MRKLTPLAVAAATVLAVAGCQAHRPAHTPGPARPAASGAAATPPSTPAQASDGAPTPGPPRGASAATPAASAPANVPATARPQASPTTRPAGIPLADACSQDTLLSSIRGLAADMTTGVQRVKVYNCVSGYARLYAVPNPDPQGGQPAGDQFFLQFSSGQWQVLARGDAVDCGDGDPKLAQACAAFG
jgi:hypothetical protein